LVPGSRLGPYEILATIGAGGMGEVYRARDTKLDRDVAIKVLPDALAADPERIARFEREAKALASLNHPNIAHIHGLEESDGVRALVMELVEGPTLEDRLAQGPVHLEEALSIARQIAEGLEAAHESGIIHRDLKPANVKVRPDGMVKILDFGLARAFDPSRTSGVSGTLSPTLSLQATYAGVILGTAAYMSPEQAAGKPVDKRADIWSFGVVVWEMLTGRQLFRGETISHTLADVLRADIDFSRLPANTPAIVGDVLRRCLDRDTKLRLRDIGEARIAINRVTTDPAARTASTTRTADSGPKSWWRRAAPAALSAMLAAGLVAWVVWILRPSVAPPAVTRFTIALPEQQLTNTGRQFLGISPDGRQIAYFANRQIYLRPLTAVDTRPIAGSQMAAGLSNITFSPDGRSIAFWMGDNTLKRIDVTGGTAMTLSTVATNPFGMSWDDTGIMFAVPGQGIMRVPANGGTPELVARVPSDEISYGPQMLPDHATMLFTVRKIQNRTWDTADIVAQRVNATERQTLIRGGSDARYVPTGHIVYAVGGTIFAVPFDVQRARVTGPPAPVIDGVRRATGAITGAPAAQMAISASGSLIYVPGPTSTSLAQRELVFFDRRSGSEPLKLPKNLYLYPRISPDGKLLAYETDNGTDAVIWVYELSGLTAPRRLTFGGRNQFPIWSGDSQWIAFQSDRESDGGIFRQRVDGTGLERLTKAEPKTSHIPESWSRDGRTMSFTSAAGDSTSRLMLFSMDQQKSAAIANLQSPSAFNSVISPDGRWIAYSYRATGTATIQVQPIPANGTVYEVSKDAGAHHPLWSPDGTELFYFPLAGPLTGVRVTTKPVFAVSEPIVINAGLLANTNPLTPMNHDVTRDGQHFIATFEGLGTAPQINVVLNWFQELKGSVPVK